MKMYKTNLENLVQYCLDSWSAPFSDDASAIARDEARYRSALANQSEYTDEEIQTIVGKIWNGEMTRKDIFDE
jgi:hypothetical protein